jgi:hypothetical protein
MAVTHAAELEDFEGTSVYACACLPKKNRVPELYDLERYND